MRTPDVPIAANSLPAWLVAISALSTMQSAATFLGAPDNSYRGDYSYLTSNFAAIIAAFIVARFLIPRFYAIGATTVYELLEARFDATARRAAAGMYLVGRILASGARLYLAAIAVSMIIFLDVEPQHIVIASAVLVIFGVVFDQEPPRGLRRTRCRAVERQVDFGRADSGQFRNRRRAAKLPARPLHAQPPGNRAALAIHPHLQGATEAVERLAKEAEGQEL